MKVGEGGGGGVERWVSRFFIGSVTGTSFCGSRLRGFIAPFV